MRLALKLLAGWFAISVVGIPGGPLWAQVPPATPKFEVASIRPCEPIPEGAGRRGGGIGVTPGRLHVVCASVELLIQAAYVTSTGKLLGAVPLAGAPRWISSEQYNIEAEAQGTPSGQMMQGSMLQALLEDRFHLKVRHETKEVPVYELTVAKSGLKMQVLPEGACAPYDATKIPDFTKPIAEYFKGSCSLKRLGRGSAPGQWMIEMRGVTFDQIADNLRTVVDRAVINKTEIRGLFNFHLEFAPDQTSMGGLRGDGTTGPALPMPEDPAGGPSIFNALQEQLGLKLQPAKGSYGESLIIERIERPSSN